MVLQALILKKDQIEYFKTRAIIQAVVDAKEADEALKAYRDVQFPYYQKQQSSQKRAVIDQLMNEVKKGGFVVTPVGQQKKMRSRLKTRVVERTAEDQKQAALRVSNRLGSYV